LDNQQRNLCHELHQEQSFLQSPSLRHTLTLTKYDENNRNLSNSDRAADAPDDMMKDFFNLKMINDGNLTSVVGKDLTFGEAMKKWPETLRTFDQYQFHLLPNSDHILNEL
jgi:hypothetical protein